MKKCLSEMHQFELTDPVGASTIILFKDIDKYAFMCGSNFNETDIKKLLLICLNYADNSEYTE